MKQITVRVRVGEGVSSGIPQSIPRIWLSPIPTVLVNVVLDILQQDVASELIF